MGKTLISIRKMQELQEKGQKELYVDKNTLISPAAKDYASEKRIKIICGQEQVCQPNVNTMIVDILKKDFNVVDEGRVNNIVRKVLEKINE